MALGVFDSFAKIGAINKLKHFLSTHYIEGIPDFLLKDIGCLYESKILRDKGMKILNVYNNQLKMIKEAECI